MSDDSNTYNPSQRPPAPTRQTAPSSSVDTLEHGAARDGQPQLSDRRLFMQLLVFAAPVGKDPVDYGRSLLGALGDARLGGVVYEDLNDPRGFGLLSFSENPADFVTRLRPCFREGRLSELVLRPEMTMLGRTYSSGFEPNLEHWLLERPRDTALHASWPWAVWYPLRRKGSFEQLDGKDKGGIMREHGEIGRAYGEADLAHDIRLACHGLDASDNEFVIGLIGKSLHPLSHVVQSMRRTRQTSEFMEKMGPFFVGHVVHRSTAR